MSPFDLKVLDAVREQISILGVSPSIRGLAGQLNTGPSAIQRSYDRLVEAGQLTRRPGRHRGIDLARSVDLRAVPTDDLEVELGRRGVTFRALSRVEPMRRTRGAPCAATYCGELVGRGHLFCRDHWFTIPIATRQEIMRAFGRRDETAYGLALTRARDFIDNADARSVG